jgi:hypothetical protein
MNSTEASLAPKPFTSLPVVLADRVYGASRISAWINVEDLLLGASPDAWDDD